MSAPRLAAPLRAILALPPRRPRLTLTIALLLAILAAVGVSRIRPSASLQDLLGEGDPAAAALDRVMERFPQTDDLYILLTESESSPRPRAEDAARDLLAAAADLRERLLADPRTRELVAAVTYAADPALQEFIAAELIPAALFYLDDDSFEAFVQRLTPEAMREQIRQNEAMISAPGPAAGTLAKQLLRDPLRLREFLSDRLVPAAGSTRTWRGGPEFLAPDGRALLMRVSGVRPATDLDFCKRFTAAVRDVTADADLPARALRADLSGAYAIAAASATAIRSDAITSVVCSVVVLQLLFLVVYRRFAAFPLAFFPVALGILLAFGLHSLFSRDLTPLTAVIGAVLAGLGIDFSIHYLSHFHATRASPPSPEPSPAAVADRTIVHIGVPLAAAGTTSVLGFLAIAFSGAAALRDFAILGALGLALALIATVTALPALLAAIDRRRPPAPPHAATPRARLPLRPVIEAAARRPRACIATLSLLLLAAAAIAASAGLPHLETDLSVMHPRPNPPLQIHREIAQRFGGLADPLVVHITADSEPQLLSRAHAVHAAAHPTRDPTAAPQIATVYGLATLLPEPAAVSARAAQIHSRLDPRQITADFTAAVADSIFDPAAFAPYADFLRELVSQHTPPSIDTLRAYPALAGELLSTSPSSHEAITLIFPAAPLDNRPARDSLISHLRGALAPIPGVTLTGIGVVSHDIELMVQRDIPRVLLVCTIAVALTILAVFRRPADLALVLLPVAFSVAAVLAYMALAGERFNLANMVAMPLLLGICVDYAIFTVGLARRAAADGPAALKGRLGVSAQAMTMTSATTIVGFGSLILTSTPAIQSLGRLVVVGVAASLAGALFLLIPVLIIIHRAPAPDARP